jgi:CheY-like chemotaxis protein
LEERIYRRTAAGAAALASGDSAVPSDYRRILGVIDGDTPLDVVRGSLRQYSDALLAEWLDEMVDVGLLEAVQPDDNPFNLDFTAYFSRPSAASVVRIDEDAAELGRSAADASRALANAGAYLSDERLANRPPLAKAPGDTTVLIVEDDPDQLALADLRVTLAGYNVRVARSAAELVAELRKDARIDLILLDVMLPDGDGFDILVRMRRHPQLAMLPVVMLTAKSESEDILSGLVLGADGYVTKPYSRNILADTIRKVLKQAPAA